MRVLIVVLLIAGAACSVKIAVLQFPLSGPEAETGRYQVSSSPHVAMDQLSFCVRFKVLFRYNKVTEDDLMSKLCFIVHINSLALLYYWLKESVKKYQSSPIAHK